MDIQPHRPQGGTNPGRPISGASPNPRPLMNDFAPRRATQPSLPPRPVAPPQPIAQPVPPAKPTPLQPQPVAHPVPHQPATAPRPHQLPPKPASHPQPVQHPEPLLESGELPRLPASTEDTPKASKERTYTGHAGLVGLGVFALLTALLVSPLLPGKVLENFPGSSATLSSGDQSLACIEDIQNPSSTTAYQIKLGAPLVYKYSATTTLQGTCQGKSQTAVGGHTSQFNPLALVINIALAAGIAVAVSVVWRKIFGDKG